MLTKDEITGARAICKAASGGDWQSFHKKYNAGWYADGVANEIKVLFASNSAFGSVAMSDEDKDFFIAARTGWPKALDEVERLRSLITEIAMCMLCEDHERVRDHVRAALGGK